MKYFLFILLSIALIFELKSQKHTIELSTGYTNFGSSESNGTNLNFSFQKKINKILNFYSQINFSSGILAKNLGTKDYDGYPYAVFYVSNQVKKLNIGPSIGFFRNRKNSFSIEPLLSIAYFKQLSTSGFIRNLNPNIPKESLYFGLPFIYKKGYTIGLMSQIGYRFKINRNIKIGFDSSLQNLNGNSEINLSAVLSHSFK